MSALFIQKGSSGNRTAYVFIIVAVSVLFTIAGNSSAREIHRECATCHSSDYAAIKSGINEVCLKCHQSREGKDHPVGIVSNITPPQLPLDDSSRITCATCHEPHGKNSVGKLLRKEFNSLCISCHKNI